jgi:hypothetical protein
VKVSASALAGFDVLVRNVAFGHSAGHPSFLAFATVEIEHYEYAEVQQSCLTFHFSFMSQLFAMKKFFHDISGHSTSPHIMSWYSPIIMR